MTLVRHAARSDTRVLSLLIECSVRELQREIYTPLQIELALANVYGVDTVLIDDGTYFLIADGAEIIACGGWSKRATLCGGDGFAGRTDAVLDPAADAAKIRAFFVRPSHVRRGLASLLLERCEREARSAGFRRGRDVDGRTILPRPRLRARRSRRTSVCRTESFFASYEWSAC